MARILIVDDSPFTRHLLGVLVTKGGEAVLKKIMQFHPYANAIMITGWADKSIEKRILAACAKAFLEKSHVQNELLQTIDKVLEN